MTQRYKTLIFILTTIFAIKTIDSEPKFGDRIGKLKRNFHTSTTTTSSPSIFNQNDIDDNFNDIRRSDDYYSFDDHENDKFMVITKKGEKKNDEDVKFSFPNTPKQPPQKSTSTSTSPQQVNNRTYQLNSPSSNLVQARLEMLTDFFDVPPSPMSSVYSTMRARDINITKNGMFISQKNSTNSSVDIKTFKIENGLKEESWALPTLIFSLIAMLLMAVFEIFVLCKTRNASPSRRHLFLGQMLLLGLFICAGLSTLLTTKPTAFSCTTIRFGIGFGFAIIFASLLVKCIFLISLNSGVYLPAPYQALLLFFAVLIQVTIDVQWLMTSPSAINFLTTSEMPYANETVRFSTIQVCKTGFSDLRTSLIYIDLLIVIVTVLAVKSRGIRDNYREATFIGLTVALVIPIWIGWTFVGLTISEKHKDSCLAFALLVISLIIFLTMFMPKGRQLAAMGREDLFVEERDERLNSGLDYSPSFFHFKPIKYGVMGGKGNLSDNENNTNNHAVTTLGDDLFVQDDSNAYSTLEHTMSSNPNVFFQKAAHPGMIY